MCWVRGVSDDLCRSGHSSVCVEFIQGWKLSANDPACRPHHPLHPSPQPFRGAPVPYAERKCQYTFNGGAVELKQDLSVQAELLELPQEEKPLLRLNLHECGALVIPGKGTQHGGAQERE